MFQCESRTSLLVVPFLEADKHPDLPTYTDHNAKSSVRDE